jgi:hypothetical protein
MHGSTCRLVAGTQDIALRREFLVRGTLHAVNGEVLSKYILHRYHTQCSVNSSLINSAGLCSASTARIVLSVGVRSVSAQSAFRYGRFFHAHYLVDLIAFFVPQARW